MNIVSSQPAFPFDLARGIIYVQVRNYQGAAKRAIDNVNDDKSARSIGKRGVCTFNDDRRTIVRRNGPGDF